MMSRFPVITETFILYEILEHQRRGEAIEIYPLMRHHEAVVHPDVATVVNRVHFKPFISFSILADNWHFLRHRWRAYLSVIVEVLRGTFGSRNFFLGTIVFFPKCAAFARDMERRGIAHVHAHFATHPALAALVIHRLTGIPFSFTAHGHDVQCDRRMLGEKLGAAEFVVTVSNYNRELMVRECGEHLREKIHVIHCGVDTAHFTPESLRRSPGPLRIICTATLREVKGHAHLIEACRLLRQRGIAFHCDLIGSGELRTQVEAQIDSAGLADAFALHGPQPRAEVRRILHAADVHVLPSVLASNGMHEGIPVALMEAMACGLPVVSSAISGIPELVEDGISGLLAAPRDSTAIADALERLAGDPDLRARMGAAGRKKVIREFDLAANTAKLAALFARSTSGLLDRDLKEDYPWLRNSVA